ncbi:nuclear factor of activated T-cells 5-like [Drosophila ficusphila]|uniref:nuclear factor of activated T-cells 5-like n=1 Tax=Drosophila ficusphila TaxID=30025 RepID=UPI0007E6E9C2|nr:nuclear factor of activated T-cells 5-like [Drosophila ficusphila]
MVTNAVIKRKTQRRPISSAPPRFGSFPPPGQQYPAFHSQAGVWGGGKLTAVNPSLPQQQQQQRQQQLQQQQFLGASSPYPVPSYADQMQAAVLDYHRTRQLLESQQQMLQQLYQAHPDVSAAQIPNLSPPPADGGHFAYRAQPQFNRGVPGSVNGGGAGVGTGASRNGPGGDFYSTQQHMGFLQQQQQDVLRDQQQSVAQQFATSQLAPTTRQSFGMAVPMSSVLGSPSYQLSLDDYRF